MHSGQSNETEPKTLTFAEVYTAINFQEEENVNSLRSQVSEEWRKYIDAGLDFQRGNPEKSEILNLIHTLGQKTSTKPLSHRSSSQSNEAENEIAPENVGEAGEAQGAEEIAEIEEVEPEIAEVVKANFLKVEKKSRTPTKKIKNKRKKKRRKRKKPQKVGLMEFLQEPKKTEELETKEEEVEQPEKPKPKKITRRRKRRKNKVIYLNEDSKKTEADLLERKKFEDKISVRMDFVMDHTSKAQYEGEKGVKAWSGGSGYGSNHTQDTVAWDINTWLVSEQQLQTEIRDSISTITQNLTEDPLFVDFLTQSCLLNVLYNYCENDSLNDIETQSKLYTEVFECLGKMLSIPAFVPFLHQKIRRFSIAQCLSTLAAKFQKRMALEKLDDGEENPLAGLVITLSNAMNQEEEDVEPNSDSGQSSDGKDKENYCELMRELCFDSVETMKDFPGHKYAKTSVIMKRKLMKRLAAEYSDLGVSLPIHEESSVFFRFCEENMSHAQMLIIPPEGTPYASGCFIFDVCFPTSYPVGPPRVNLQTTGRGAVRFNPNLYNCGKVCLSLLGTWGGQSQGEKWNPELSSFLQVAISIQSLIFVPEPYYNEPGWERYMGTADGDRRSRNYNKVIEKGTVDYAIVEMLENPPAAFKDVINNHFCRQADRVLSNVARWMGEDAAVTQKVETLLTELRTQMFFTGA